MTTNPLQLASLAALLLAGAALVYLQGENALQAERISTLQRDVTAGNGLAVEQAAAITALTGLQADVAIIRAASQATHQALAAQSAALGRDLQELKRNDQAITAYLTDPVPAAVGLRWVRSESTDPLSYRQSAVVRPGAVSPASVSSAAKQ